jgi:hypothetical protein
LVAQHGAGAYHGLRAGVLEVQITDQRPALILISCRIANTGKADIPPDQSKAGDLLVELDTAALPMVLLGLEPDIAEAVRRLGLRLKPGEISKRVNLEISLPSPTLHTKVSPRDCPDLVFDTAWLVRFDAKEIGLKYIIKNKGKSPAFVLKRSGARQNNLALHAYFVRESSLTSGAILAETTNIQEGIESFDGILGPGQSMTGSFTVSRELYTRFSPNIVLELDPFSSVDDCDRTNNTIAILSPW